jgi:pSer/pThr/pTyr-binding forkhead associated (FHA) protein
VSIPSEPLHLRLKWDNPYTGEYHECVNQLPITIGRAASLNEIVLNNKLVSRQHARLEGSHNRIVLIDQDSTNGTFVDGCRVERATLNEGTSFKIGPFTFISFSCTSVNLK